MMSEMGLPVAFFALLALATGFVAFIGPAAAWRRATAFCAVLPLAILLHGTSLGLTRPLWFMAPTGRVLAYRLAEPRAIYVWVLPPGAAEPLAVALPWDEQTAQQLRKMMQRAAGDRGTVMMTRDAHGHGKKPRKGQTGGSMAGKAAGGHGQGTFGLGGKAEFYQTNVHALPPKVAIQGSVAADH